VRRLRKLLFGDRTGVPIDNDYRRRLLQLFYEYVAASHGEALDRDEFIELVHRHSNRVTIKQHNRYLGDLWNLFQPDYRDRLGEHYAALALPSTMSFLAYAGDPGLIDSYYVVPYRIALGELQSPVRILEVGGGIPHGFIHEQLAQPGFCEHLTLLEIDAPYSAFVEWFARQEGVPFEFALARAGEAGTLPAGPFGFVFAKDVLEHLHDPERMIDEIARVADTRAVLALDLDDKGPRAYQHVTPTLSHLSERVAEHGFAEFARSGNLTLYRRP
jgi:SAM-dependent methyltransferase